MDRSVQVSKWLKTEVVCTSLHSFYGHADAEYYSLSAQALLFAYVRAVSFFSRALRRESCTSICPLENI